MVWPSKNGLKQIFLGILTEKIILPDGFLGLPSFFYGCQYPSVSQIQHKKNGKHVEPFFLISIFLKEPNEVYIGQLCLFQVIAHKRINIGRCSLRHCNQRKTFFPMPQTPAFYLFSFRNYNLNRRSYLTKMSFLLDSGVCFGSQLLNGKRWGGAVCGIGITIKISFQCRKPHHHICFRLEAIT